MHRRDPRRSGSQRALACALASLWIALCAFDAGAADRLRDGVLEITADVIEFDSIDQVYVGEGHVHVLQVETGRTLDAEWIVFSNQTRRGVASGDVLLRDGEDRLSGDFAVFDVDSLRGRLTEGSLEAPDENGSSLRLWARELVKTGDDTYTFRRGTLTTCNCPDDDDRDPWRIRASSADVEIGGYGTFRNATLDVLEFPVFWVPWMLLPVKTDRETGILFPEFSNSNRRGFDVGLPIFFALGDPVNLTLTPRWSTKRGYKQDGKLEYVLGRKSWGRLSGSFIRDQEVLDEQDDANEQNAAREAELQEQRDAGVAPEDLRSTISPAGEQLGSNRWAVLFRSETELPRDWPGHAKFVTDVNLASDNDHPDDFRDLEEFRRDRFLESRVFGFNHFGSDGRVGLVASMFYADDLQSPDDSDRDDFLLQRMPDVELSWLPTPLRDAGGLVAAFDTDYIHFRARHDPANHVGEANEVDGLFFDTGFDALPDSQEKANPTLEKEGRPLIADPNKDDDTADSSGPEGDGKFQEGEPLADEGHRFTLYPRLSRPFRVANAFELTPEIGYMQTLYWTDNQDFAERGLVSARLDWTTQLQRRFDGGDRGDLHHLFEPTLSYVLAESRGQSGDPIFVPETRLAQRRIRQLEVANVFDDPADRIRDRNGLNLVLANRIYRDAPSGRRMLADFSVGADVDFEDGGFGRFVVDGTTRRASGFTTRFNLTLDPEDPHLDEALAALAWKIPKLGRVVTGGAASFRYRYVRQIPLFFENFRGDDADRFDDFEGGFDHVNQIETNLRVNLGRHLILGGRLVYSFEDSLRLSTRGGIDYVSRCRCWAAGFGISDGRNRGLEYSFRITLLGPGDDPSNPFAGQSPLGLQSGVP